MKLKIIVPLFSVFLIMVGCDTRTPTPPDKVVSIYHLTLSTDRAVIYADNGQTVAQITAYLTDADGVPKSGSSVVFFPAQGKMVGTVNTDQTGRATSNFDDDGQSAEAVLIVGQYTDSESNVVRDSISIQVLPMEALVDTFFVDTQPIDGIIEVTSIDESSSIEIFSHVFDANGSPVSNVQVEYRIINREAGVGFIDIPSDSTNEIGVSQTTFFTNIGRLGDVQIAATISNDAVQTLLRDNPGVYSFNLQGLAKGMGAEGIVFSDTAEIHAVASPPYDLLVSTLDNIIYADQGITTSRIVGIVRDTDGNPVENVSVSFSSNYGTINSPKLTNDAGVAQTTFSDLGSAYIEDQLARITGRVTHPFFGDIVDSVNVLIRIQDDATTPNFFVITQPASGQILVTNLDSAYTANILAQVRDNNGVALEGVTVDFRVLSGSALGYLSGGTDISDSTGTARVTFNLNPGMAGTVVLEAFIAGDDTVDPISTEIVFVPLSDYEINAFTYQDLIYFDNGLTMATVYAVVRDLNGNSVDSERVEFSSDIGTVASPVYTSNSGVAETYFSDLGAVGPDPATATVTMRVEHPFWGMHSSAVEIEIEQNIFEIPRLPAFIDMSASYNVLPPTGMLDTTFSRLTLFVSDSSGVPVDEGTEVTFGSNIGFITPFTLTNEAGWAFGIFSMGDSSGIAKIYAYSGIATDSVLIQVRPMEAAYIVIPPVSPSSIVVQGGWGAESTTLFAEVRDARGELVDLIYDVTFEIGPAPGGSNLDGVGNAVTVETNYGIASVTLNSGTEAGPVQVTVSTTTLEGVTISSTGIPVSIRAGLPAHMTADINIIDITPVGGGFYELEVAALVWDQFTNPVEDSTQVYWSLIPDTLANIVGESYTYNENLNGDAYHGIAWSKMYFNSGNIFNIGQIIASTWGANGDTVKAYVNGEDGDSTQMLTFYPGTLTITPSESFHDFGTNPTPNPYPITLSAYLIDHYNNATAGGRILFQAIGAASWEDIDGNPLDPPVVITDQNGLAQVVVYFDRALCTPNFNAEDEVISYDPFTAYVWGMLLDPVQVSSEQMSIELRRSIPE